jgi:DNA gyrase subunit A
MRRGLIDVARKTTTTMVVSGSPTPRIGAVGGRRAAVGRRNNNTDDFQTRRLNQMLTVRGMHATRTTAFAADNAEEKIVDVELADEAKNSYLSYAMSVIVGRALPDARDGLKPVHRRILYGMHELGLKASGPHRKCARVVGDVLGKYHPHGDGSVYEALVRLAQDFSMSAPLVDGHGNFGSLDDDPPAAMRYTECRLNKLAEQTLLADIGNDCVGFSETFDGSQMEPTVLPARVPNLLINGSSGIAVAVATNMAPHNLSEAVDAMCFLAKNPDATVEELMKHLPAPDFPTGGVVINKGDMKTLYKTGKGAVVLRGRTAFEKVRSSSGLERDAIIISEIPYQTNKASLVEQIADHVNGRTIEGISDIRDESDRDGMRIVIELKRGYEPETVLGHLHKKTKLEVRYNVNNVALLDNKPTTMSLREILNEFISFRVDTIERRTRFLLSKAQDRKHLVEGYLAVLSDADGVVKIIRGSKDGPTAAKKLRDSHGLSSIQADAILAMPLRRLTGLEADKLEAELTDLNKQIQYFNGLLSDKSQVIDVLVQEAQEAKDAFGRPRRTSLSEVSASNDGEDVTDEPPKDNILTLSERGYIKRICPKNFGAQNRGTRGKRMSKLRANDELSFAMHCMDSDSILFFSDRGRLQKISAKTIPQSELNTIGMPVTQLLSSFAQRNQKVSAMLRTDMKQDKVDEDQVVVMLTNQGKVSVAAASAVLGQRSKMIIKLEKGDRLRQVLFARTSDHLFITGAGNGEKGKVLHCKVSDFRVVKAACRPVYGMKFIESAATDDEDDETETETDDDGDDDDDDDEVLPARTVGMVLVSDERMQNANEEDGPFIFYATKKGKGKVVAANSYRLLSRGRSGVTCMKFKKGDDDALATVTLVDRIGDDVNDEILVSTTGGISNRLSVNDLPVRTDPNALGAFIIRLSDSDSLKSVSLLPSEVASELA